MKTIHFLILISLLLVGCASSTPTSVMGSPWPTLDWQTDTPASQNIDSVLLDKMQAEIKSSGLALDSLLIIRNGVIISETYYAGSRRTDLHVQYSVTKSFISTLVGLASDQGKLHIDQNVSDFFPVQEYENPDPRKQVITVENLLSMSSGLEWVEADSSFNSLYRSQDWARWMLGLAMENEPGQKFKYCSGCSHVLSAILNQTVGGNVERFAKDNLFRPLGIKDYRWEKDPQGIPIGGWGLDLKARDMAKLGYLYLNNGRWEDRQVLSASWVKAATTKRMPTDGNLGYGYQWWTYPNHHAYTALGRGGQTIFVVPDLHMIVVTTANLSGGHEPIFHLIDTYIIPAVKD